MLQARVPDAALRAGAAAPRCNRPWCLCACRSWRHRSGQLRRVHQQRERTVLRRFAHDPRPLSKRSAQRLLELAHHRQRALQCFRKQMPLCTLLPVLQSTMRVVTRHGQVHDNQTFSVNDPQGRIAAWNATTGWLHGYWAFDWCAVAATHKRAPHSIAAFQGRQLRQNVVNLCPCARLCFHHNLAQHAPRLPLHTQGKSRRGKRSTRVAATRSLLCHALSGALLCGKPLVGARCPRRVRRQHAHAHPSTSQLIATQR